MASADLGTDNLQGAYRTMTWSQLGPVSPDGHVFCGVGIRMQRPASCHSVQFAQPEPSMLKVEKTGPASCAPGMDCPFDITISNTGRSDHKGAISITDGLSGAPAMSIASISPPLPCSTQPTDIPFSCKTADDFALSAGDKRTFRVTARIPRSTTERFTNCAIVSTLKTVDDDGRSANSSCVTIAPTEKPRTPTTSECRGGNDPAARGRVRLSRRHHLEWPSVLNRIRRRDAVSLGHRRYSADRGQLPGQSPQRPVP